MIFDVSEAVKFPVTRPTKKQRHEEVQTHGYEVDLVGARSDLLVLATVKSFFGSRGVQARAVRGEQDASGYALLNDPTIRTGVVEAACARYGYHPANLRVRLYVGKFAGGGRAAEEEAAVREWCGTQHIGGGPLEVRSLDDIIGRVRQAASSKTYRNNPVIVTMKVLAHAGLLAAEVSEQLDESNEDLGATTTQTE